MNAPTLNWTIFDNHTPRDFGQYTVKYYTSNDTGGICYFYINSISGTFGSGLKWSYDNATQELKNIRFRQYRRQQFTLDRI